MKNKKAISPIISVALSIVIVIAIAGIILVFSRNFVKDKKVETQGFSGYYDAKLYILNGDSSSDTLQLGVERLDNEGHISGARFIFEGEGISYSYDDVVNPPNDVGIVEVYDVNAGYIGLSDFSDIQKISIRLLYGNKRATNILDYREIE